MNQHELLINIRDLTQQINLYLTQNKSCKLSLVSEKITTRALKKLKSSLKLSAINLTADLLMQADNIDGKDIIN